MLGDSDVPHVVFISVLLFVVSYFAVIGGVTGVLIEKDDYLNWGTTTTLNLSINVTRIIQEDDTTFIYPSRGDEESIILFHIGESRVIKNPTGNVIEIFPTKYLRLSGGLGRPVLEMLIIRNNGTRETYNLPTRGGEVPL